MSNKEIYTILRSQGEEKSRELIEKAESQWENRIGDAYILYDRKVWLKSVTISTTWNEMYKEGPLIDTIRFYPVEKVKSRINDMEVIEHPIFQWIDDTGCIQSVVIKKHWERFAKIA